MLRIFISLILMLEILCFTVGCALTDEKEKVSGISSPVEPDGDLTETPDATGVITLGALSSGKSKITIPLECFGEDESDVGTATIDVMINEETYVSDIDAGKYYHDSEAAVVFYLSGISSGDEVSFAVTHAEGKDNYSGVVGSAESSATME